MSKSETTQNKFKYLQIHKIAPVKERFILNNKTKQVLRNMEPDFGFNGLGEVVFRRTYSRNNEDWCDVVIRVIEGVMTIRKEHFYKNSLTWNDNEWQNYSNEMAISLFKMEWLPPGRGLWTQGCDIVYERGATALNNCAAVDTCEDLTWAASTCMDLLMNGVGVGFSTYWRGTANKPDKTDIETYIIDDSREGWVESLIILMSSYINSPRYGETKFPFFDYSEVREAGKPIKGFGGLSSGPEPLKKLHKRIEEYLDNFSQGFIIVNDIKKEYNHTRVIADIFNAIGACVVAGNVRRSAEMCLGDVNDETFMNLKNYNMNPERMDIGWMSNNSIVLKAEHNYDDFTYIPDLAKRICSNGEPGMINMVNIQKYGRYGKIMNDNAYLVNPCSEILLENGELCNLSETFPPRCKDVETFYQALRYATFYASTVSLLPTHIPEVNKVIARNRRIGVSISGVSQWASGEVPEGWGTMNYTKMTKFLREGYDIVRDENSKLAKEAGIPASIRVTTIKPSGSISLLAGCTPGVHYPVSRYAIRRMRIGMDSPLVPALKDANIPWEIDKYSDNTLVFEFVVDHGNVRPSKEVSAWEQLSLTAMLQRTWADNSVSATIYIRQEEKPDVEKMLAMYIPVLKCVSMLPSQDNAYEQAPYEEITKEQYEDRLSKYSKPIFNNVKDNTPEGSVFCSGESCDWNPSK